MFVDPSAPSLREVDDGEKKKKKKRKRKEILVTTNVVASWPAEIERCTLMPIIQNQHVHSIIFDILHECIRPFSDPKQGSKTAFLLLIFKTIWFVKQICSNDSSF